MTGRRDPKTGQRFSVKRHIVRGGKGMWERCYGVYDHEQGRAAREMVNGGAVEVWGYTADGALDALMRLREAENAPAPSLAG